MTRGRQELVVAGLVAAVAVGFAVAGHHSHREHADHVAYLRAVQRMHHGQGFYSAYRDAYLDIGVRIGRSRAFREPTVFLLWRLVPVGQLLNAYFASAALVTWLLAKVAERPWAALAPGVFLVFASDSTAVEYLLVEFWALPFLTGSVLMWQRKRVWPAALLAAGAVMVRETAAPLVVAGAVLAVLSSGPPWKGRLRAAAPWVVCGVAAVVFFAVHDVVANRYVVLPGNDVALAGSGDPPHSVLDMMTWPFSFIGVLRVSLLAAWILAALRLGRDRRSRIVAGLLVIPVFGIPFDRPYWGLLATPFVLALAADLLLGSFPAFRRTLAD